MTTAPDDPLPSWRDGAVKHALLDFLVAARTVPVEERVAMFDNDGTLWCEKPQYLQLLFMLDQLRQAVALDPSLAAQPEFRALIEHDHAAQAAFGLERIALALLQLTIGIGPREFDDRVRGFVAAAVDPVPLRRLRYRPMLELIAALRAESFSVFIVTGGGTEFVRAISQDFYGVPPEGVVGTLVDYDFTRDAQGAPRLVRSAEMVGTANEGAAKVVNIQRELGRRPIFAAGNTAGDREMLEYALATDGPAMALLVDHDDADREYAYEPEAVTVEFDGSFTAFARDSGWTVASIRDDWEHVFAE
jgi:phosphoglycolate phosphatase-like HAD superfamily hydrolase